MRTNIEIDDKLMSDALRLTGARSKREAVEMGLRTLLRLRQQEELRRLRGKLQWQGDLDAMRISVTGVRPLKADARSTVVCPQLLPILSPD